MIDEDKLKDSFRKIKEEMSSMQQEILVIKSQLDQIYAFLQENKRSSTSKAYPQQTDENPADNINYNKELSLNSKISIGNDGVPADSQQTVNRHSSTLKRTFEEEQEHKQEKENEKENEKISKLVDNLKKDLKEKFRSLTKQEFFIFSLLYSMSEEKQVSYKDLALKSGLTESSIRDYITRLEHKGIPISRERINNKQVILKIPEELKDIATLESLSKLKKF